jgi:hypothetical protein
MSTSPDSHLDSQVGQGRSDFIELDHLNVTVSPHSEVGVLTGHRPLVSENRRFLTSPGGCERSEGRATYVSKAPMGTEGVPKHVNDQEGNHDGTPGSNPDSPDINWETEHRVMHAMGRMPQGPDIRKIRYRPRASFCSLACLTVSLETEIPQGDQFAPEPSTIELPRRTNQKRSVLRGSTQSYGLLNIGRFNSRLLISSSVPEVSLVIYDLNPDRRKPPWPKREGGF